MTVFLYIYMLIIGFMLGFMANTVYTYHKSKKTRKRLDQLIDVIKKHAASMVDMPDSVLDRLKQAQKIEADQLNMVYAAEGPQRGILDGRNRQGLSHEIKKLSEEKKELLASIIREGHDPSITVLNDGKKESMKLSEYMKLNGEVYSEDKVVEEKPKTKLTLIKNKDE